MEERVTDVLVQEFIRDGRLRVVSTSQADLQLDAKLLRYDLKTVSLDQTEEAVVFRLDTELDLTLKDLRTGQILVKDEHFKESGDFFLSNQPSAQREEQIYIRMAESIISRVLQHW